MGVAVVARIVQSNTEDGVDSKLRIHFKLVHRRDRLIRYLYVTGKTVERKNRGCNLEKPDDRKSGPIVVQEGGAVLI